MSKIVIGVIVKMNMVFCDKYGNKKVITGGNKVFYDEENNKILLNTGSGVIGYGLYGIVYKYGEDKCLKYITTPIACNEKVIKEIMQADLSSFYKIYKLLFDRHHDFNGYIMKYYDNPEIDILMMPTSYTLDNYYGILKDAEVLSDKGIYMHDMHSENVILGSDKMTIIDVDNYMYVDTDEITNINVKAVKGAFYDIYADCVRRHHSLTKEEYNALRTIFGSASDASVYEELKNYKYPLDYIKKKSLTPIKYVMKKGI